MEEHCPTAIEETVADHGRRIKELETRTNEIEKLIAKINVLVDSMNRLQWIIITGTTGIIIAAIAEAIRNAS